MERLPLGNTRVLDLTTWWAGPMAGMILADLGAEVIKIEARQRLDAWRGSLARGSEGRAHEASPAYATVHRDKLGITLDLASAEGKELFLRLVKVSDVVLEAFSPRVMPQLGFGFDVLQRVSPGIIQVSMTGFGLSGPWRDYVSFAPVAEGLSGLSALTGYERGDPMIHGVMPADPLAGLNAATATLLALQQRQRSGRGLHVDQSQLEVMACAVGEPLMDWQMNRRARRHQGNRSDAMAPHRCYPTKGDDEWIAIAVRDDRDWQALRRAMDNPAWAQDPELVTAEGRRRHREELGERLAAWTRAQDKQELMVRLQQAGVPAGAVNGPVDLLQDPHLRARGYYQDVERTELGVLPYPVLPIRFSKTPTPIRFPAPTLGQHNGRVYGELLGLGPEELAALERKTVIGTEPIGEMPLRS